MCETQSETPEMGIGEAQSQSGSTTEPPKRISELQNQVYRLNANLQYLEKALGNLCAKLKPILYPILDPSVPSAENKSVQEAMNTDVGKLLQQFSYKLEIITSTLDDVTRRLEV